MIVTESKTTAITRFRQQPSKKYTNVFWMGVFCSLTLKIYLETIIVSTYCLKFLSNTNCLYCIKGGFVKIIFASGNPIVATFFFLDSNSLFISISRWRFILNSVFRGKFIFPKSIKYLKGILRDKFFF